MISGVYVILPRGAEIVEEMVVCERGQYGVGFWFWDGAEDKGMMEKVEW
jgi:hypothetical protein